MYLKVTKARGYSYLKLVKSVWQDGRSKQQTIANLGRLDHLQQSGQLRELGRKFLSLDRSPIPNTIDDLQELNRFSYGDIVHRKLWEQYHFTQILQSLIKNRKIDFDFIRTVYLLVVDRLLNSRSKLAVFENQEHYINIENVELQHIYRSLDVLAEEKQRIESHIFQRQRNLFNQTIDVVFYDVTTFHFESVRADEFREFGFSKAGKMNEVQVVMGLLLDMDAQPVGYDLFPGNTFEGDTLVEALEALEERFQIRRLIFVADQAFNSGKNLHRIHLAGYDYIVSSRIKNLPKQLQERILTKEDYQVVEQDEDGNALFSYKVIGDHQFKYKDESGEVQELSDNLVLYWSKDRAHRDQQERQRMIEKAQQMIQEKQPPFPKKGYKRYVATEGSHKAVGLDEERMRADARWDGIAGIQCSDDQMNAREIIDAYSQLWRIENSFRILKTTMRTRPIYHWTPKRIQGHFVICFIAFVLERALENKLKKSGIETSPEKIKQAINSLEISEIQLGDQIYYLKSKHQPLAGKILKALRIKHLKNVSAREELPFWQTFTQ